MRPFHTASQPHHTFTHRPNPYVNRLVAAHAPKVGRIGRWYLPSMALICLGFGISNYIRSHSASTMSSNRDNQLNAQQLQLLESYGNRNTLDDVERAMEIYEVQ
ncbi:conserved hypothetical protein [Paecilomyces variotii No. 5]|uniref:Uncharacterized protein n=1 Tax=Byssochlamys spectabilis (strain No. 5 / NBRC 109023) TaxID=1356009 RepID=V5G9E5_BYSSN|nr:conserved hypothetical protein [Paecilomyces variotii No. 5]